MCWKYIKTILHLKSHNSFEIILWLLLLLGTLFSRGVSKKVSLQKYFYEIMIILKCSLKYKLTGKIVTMGPDNLFWWGEKKSHNSSATHIVTIQRR